MHLRTLLLLPLGIAALPAWAEAPTAEDIRSASYDGGALPDGQSGLAVKLQVLLDRAGISPGVIDGFKGGMTESALRAYEAQQGLPVDGALDADVWAALGGDDAANVVTQYIISADDTQGLSDPLPDDYAQMAELDQLGFTSVSERLAERFHMDEDFLKALNPDATFAEGEEITVTDPGAPVDATVKRIEVDPASQRLSAFNADSKMIANYPVTVGSQSTPSPSGEHTVKAVAIDPTYTYNPDVNFQQGDNDETLILPPGPNGPVGNVWIDLSKPTYGIHGTANPATLFNAQSHGCVRLTNWDAHELAEMVETGAAVAILQ